GSPARRRHGGDAGLGDARRRRPGRRGAVLAAGAGAGVRGGPRRRGSGRGGAGPGAGGAAAEDGEPPRPSVAMPWLEAVIALDTRTGREAARWQLPVPFRPERAETRGGRLLLGSSEELFCFEEGAPAPQPAEAAARRAAA